MVEYLFDPDVKSQEAVIIDSKLDDEELRMISAVVNWQNPDEWTDRIFEIHGRSIVFRSPTRESTTEDNMAGNFDGLQLIGAGGSLYGIQPLIDQKNSVGVVEVPEQIVISPVNPTNHAAQLERIVQLRKFNGMGEIEFFHRDYVPLHGMDDAEARNRAQYTAHINNMVSEAREGGSMLFFVGPKLVTEGLFPNKYDEKGNNLQFQVYRVPTLRRLHSQILENPNGLEGALEFLVNISSLVGKVLRSFHAEDLAYMDCYLGNMSYIGEDDNGILFTTDLGSMVDISNEKHVARYRAFDVYSHLFCIKKVLDTLPIMSPNGISKEQHGAFLSVAIGEMTGATFDGYFRPEIVSSPIGKKAIRSFLEKHVARFSDLVLAESIGSFCSDYDALQSRLYTGPMGVSRRIEAANR